MIYTCKKCGAKNLVHNETFPYHDIHECKDCSYTWHTRIDNCCRTPYPIVTILRYDFKRYSLYQQCINCGGANKREHLKSKNFSDQIKADFNELRFDEWITNRNEESNQIYEGIRHSNYTLTRMYKYRQYLMSDEWRKKRNKVMERNNNQCQVCKTAKAEDVHHLSYENLFNEPLKDLQALCRLCHFNSHLTNNTPKISMQ